MSARFQFQAVPWKEYWKWLKSSGALNSAAFIVQFSTNKITEY